MLFEVSSLLGAEPSLVTRCGVMYFEAIDVTSYVLHVRSWLNEVDSILPHLRSVLLGCVDQFLAASITYALSLDGAGAPTVSGHASSFKVLLDAIMASHKADLDAKEEHASKSDTEALFVFALTWAMGGNLGIADREKLDSFLRTLLTTSAGDELPVESLFDHYYDVNDSRWRPWLSQTAFFANAMKERHNFIIPTAGVVTAAYMSRLLHASQSPLLVLGESATGRAASIEEGVRAERSGASARIPLTWSTHAEVVQTVVERKLERKQRSKSDGCAGVFGPKNSGSVVVLIVEDLHMPEADLGGAQSPNEYLRQILDYQGCHHLEHLEWCSYENVRITGTASTMDALSPRLTRHFNVLVNSMPTDESLKTIYTAILSAYLPDSHLELITPMLNVTLALYHDVQHKMQPGKAPSSQHYNFGLHRLNELIRSMVSVQQFLTSASDVDFFRVWKHELDRSFRDSLGTDVDRSCFDADFQQAAAAVNSSQLASGANLSTFVYESQGSHYSLYATLMDVQSQIMDEITSGGQTDKIICPDVTVGVMRLISQQQNCLMFGAHFGRRDTCRMSSMLAGSDYREITLYDWHRSVTPWRSNVKQWLQEAGTKNTHLVIYVSCSEEADERFMVDLDALLNGTKR